MDVAVQQSSRMLKVLSSTTLCFLSPLPSSFLASGTVNEEVSLSESQCACVFMCAHEYVSVYVYLVLISRKRNTDSILSLPLLQFRKFYLNWFVHGCAHIFLCGCTGFAGHSRTLTCSLISHSRVA